MMRLSDSLLISGLLIKDVVLSPRRVFSHEISYEPTRGVVILFLTGLLITLLKTFAPAKKVFAVTFFKSSTLNSAFSSLNNPQIIWLVLYAAYFMFILLTLLMCKLLNGRVQARSLVLSLISVCAIGVLLQVICYVLKFIVPLNVIVLCGYAAYIWIAFVSMMAIKASQKMSALKAAVCFILPAIPVTIFAGLPAISPYLAWLTV
jgi:hypothetical protein